MNPMDYEFERALRHLEELGLVNDAWFLRGAWDALTGLPEREVTEPRGLTATACRERGQRRVAYEKGGRAARDAILDHPPSKRQDGNP